VSRTMWRSLAAGLGAAVVLLAGCGSGDDAEGGSGDSASGRSVIGGIGGGSGGGGGSAAGCSVVGRYAVAAITATSAAPTALGRLQVTGGQGIRLELVDDGTWALTDDGSRPVDVVTDGHRAQGRLAGRIAGTYVADGAGYRFEQTSADGEVRITSTLGSATLPISAVGPALVPGGAVTVTCADTGITLDSPTVSLRLTPAG
jgi:hypothetical protein